MIRAFGPLSLALILFAALLVGCEQEPDEAEPNPSATGQAEDSPSATSPAEPAGSETAQPEGNQRLAFISNREGPFRLYTMDADGGDIRKISDKPVASAPFSVSPDGTQIGVLGGDATGNQSPCVYRADVMGGHAELIGQVPAEADIPLALSPRWRLDDLAVLISTYEGCYALPYEGGEARKENPDECFEMTALAEGPQGKYALGAGAGLMLLDEIGAEPRILDEDPTTKEELGEGWGGLALLGMLWTGMVRPVWSPDGTLIAYLRFDADLHQAGIAVISAEGGEPRMFVSGSEDSQDIPLPGVWSLDGQRVIFAGLNDAAAIQEVSVDDGGVRTLVGNDGYAYRFPQWVTEAPAPERPAAEQRPDVAGACGAGGESGADLDLNFLRELEEAKAEGIPVYWLGTEFTVGDHRFVGPRSDSDYEYEGEETEISLHYSSRLETTPGQASTTYLYLTLYGRDAWERLKDRFLNPHVWPTEGEVTRQTVTVNGREAEMISVPSGTRPVNVISLILDLDEVVVVASAHSLLAAAVRGGGELNLFIKNPDLFVQAMQGLRPYPE